MFKARAARIGEVFNKKYEWRREKDPRSGTDVLLFDFDTTVDDVWEDHEAIVRSQAAISIQRAWIRKITDPETILCKKRLTREWEELSSL